MKPGILHKLKPYKTAMNSDWPHHRTRPHAFTIPNAICRVNYESSWDETYLKHFFGDQRIPDGWNFRAGSGWWDCLMHRKNGNYWDVFNKVCVWLNW